MADIVQAAGRANAERARPFRIGVRVYYEDTDAAGIVYYANYLRYLERARTDWLRSAGVDQRRLQADTGIGFAVRSLAAEYQRPARLDDLLSVTCEVGDVRRTQVVFDQRVERGADLLLTATVRVVCLDFARMRPVAIPENLRKMFEP